MGDYNSKWHFDVIMSVIPYYIRVCLYSNLVLFQVFVWVCTCLLTKNCFHGYTKLPAFTSEKLFNTTFSIYSHNPFFVFGTGCGVWYMFLIVFNSKSYWRNENSLVGSMCIVDIWDLFFIKFLIDFYDSSLGSVRRYPPLDCESSLRPWNRTLIRVSHGAPHWF